METRKIIDLTGQKFGMLTVLEYVARSRWKCLCDCGNETIVDSRSFTHGKTKSCGCLVKSTKFKDITGQFFGKLTVLRLDRMNNRTGAFWICVCECGKETSVNGRSLRSGLTKSCGCLSKEITGKLNFVDLIGNRFGKLIVSEYNGNSKWKCQCDCGNITFVATSSLNQGLTKSCGCLSSRNIVGNINKLPEGEAIKNALYRAYKYSAKSRSLDFSLSKESFLEIINKKCFYCGEKPSTYKYSISGNGSYILYNGIDRVNSTIGYTDENTVPSCSKCNYAKGSLSSKDFLTLIERIYNHSVKL